MTIGQKIYEVRKAKGWTLEGLAPLIGLKKSALSALENDKLKGDPDADLVNLIADTLGDNSIRLHYLENNPVYQAVIPRVFPELNHIKKDPSAIFVKFQEELEEALEAAGIIARLLSHAEPQSLPNFRETFFARLEQVVDVQRCAELVFLKLIAAGIMTVDDRREIHARQQAKCERNGHHKPEKGC